MLLQAKVLHLLDLNLMGRDSLVVRVEPPVQNQLLQDLEGIGLWLFGFQPSQW